MLLKTEAPQYYFEAQCTREEGRKGMLTTNAVKDSIKVATPPEFAGGVAGIWSPEQLFLGSLSSCTMATFLAIAEKRKLLVTGFECKATGLVQLVDGRLEFTIINLYPKVFVQKEEDIALANEVLLKTFRHCIIANSIKAKLVHHGEVLQDKVLEGKSC